MCLNVGFGAGAAPAFLVEADDLSFLTSILVEVTEGKDPVSRAFEDQELDEGIAERARAARSPTGFEDLHHLVMAPAPVGHVTTGARQRQRGIFLKVPDGRPFVEEDGPEIALQGAAGRHARPILRPSPRR